MTPAERMMRWKAANPERHKDNVNRWRKETVRGHFTVKRRTIRVNSKRRGKECVVSSGELYEIWLEQGGCCALTFRPMTISPGNSDLNSVSIDRIDNAKGYTKDNIRLVTVQANCARMFGSDKDLIAFCKDVLIHHDEKVK